MLHTTAEDCDCVCLKSLCCCINIFLSLFFFWHLLGWADINYVTQRGKLLKTQCTHALCEVCWYAPPGENGDNFPDIRPSKYSGYIWNFYHSMLLSISFNSFLQPTCRNLSIFTASSLMPPVPVNESPAGAASSQPATNAPKTAKNAIVPKASDPNPNMVSGIRMMSS